MAHNILAREGPELGLSPRKWGSVGWWLTGELELAWRRWSMARSNRARGGPARPVPSQGHATTLRSEQGGAGEEAHREVGCGGGMALPR
jgi:hypothetical protein